MSTRISNLTDSTSWIQPKKYYPEKRNAFNRAIVITKPTEINGESNVNAVIVKVTRTVKTKYYEF